MQQFVKVIVHNLADIDHTVLVKLHLAIQAELDAGRVHVAEVADVVATTSHNDHELSAKELLVVRQLQLVALRLADLVESVIAVEHDLKSLQLFGVCVEKSQFERLLWELIRLDSVLMCT